MSTPRDDGFFMPAEWAPHRRCWMAWPCNSQVWGDRLQAARDVYADIADAIAQFEPVTMIVRPDLMTTASLVTSKNISILPMAQSDSWTRDTCPSFLIDGKGNAAGVAWRFNGWGGVHQDFEEDAAMAVRVLEHLNLPAYLSELVTEGGAIHVDGEGTCLLCETAILDPARNPGLGREEVEAELRAMLGVSTFIWLEAGLADDETNGHIDNIACFARPGVVITMQCDDVDDPDYVILRRNLETLRAARDAKDRELEIVTLPKPKTRLKDDGTRLTLSYVNFYIANGGIIMPGFGDPADKVAYRTLEAVFPDREVVQIPCLDLLYGGGGIHCITQQQPAAEPAA
ncbi:MAG TPA: agmatine deiminase family protein [Geminicoccus sp.]|uniref:agmatine deiminase family protein n=1 Tax=Geminicoccus sp. TaxID=2024832 RepID=UPI002BADDBB3|nr:agmatine deiminase family protein [Geminicoccus sp.]HWL71349.1 agmatine deiminase family protein [Geminicoccus sp.]